MSRGPEDADIVKLAFELAEAVATFVEHARRFFYEVMLSGHRCPECGGTMVMVREGRCRCGSCGAEFDPTVAFQRCTDCGGVLRLRVRRYRCHGCGADVPSHFLFDGLAFDAEYFRLKVAESRQRKKARREILRTRVAENRSEEMEKPMADLHDIPGLLESLNGLTVGVDVSAWLPFCRGFDLGKYQRHLEACIGRAEVREVRFDDIPPLEENARLDRIWRFIAVIFMAHFGQISLLQEGQVITVRRNETDREGQEIPG
jgi:ssDNA-binding Zn-finger/Zn-ribbon topoisomerase 1